MPEENVVFIAVGTEEFHCRRNYIDYVRLMADLLILLKKIGNVRLMVEMNYLSRFYIKYPLDTKIIIISVL